MPKLAPNPAQRADIDPELARLAARLRRMREQRGQTLDQLATLTNLSKAYLSRLESSHRQPSAAALVSIARAWNLPTSTLLDEQDEQPNRRVLREASVNWAGDHDGEGTISVASGQIEGSYSAATRDRGEGINPEELIGAAQAGCFTMTLARLLTQAGTPPQHLNTNAAVHGEYTPNGFRITRIDLHTQATAPGLSLTKLQTTASTARRTCTISRALTGAEIVVHTELAD